MDWYHWMEDPSTCSGGWCDSKGHTALCWHGGGMGESDSLRGVTMFHLNPDILSRDSLESFRPLPCGL